MSEQQANQRQTKAAYARPNLLECPNCRALISEPHINFEKNIAKCINCNHTFSLNDRALYEADDKFAEMPEGMDVLQLTEGLDVLLKRKKQTNRNGIWPIVFFAGIWNLMLLPFIFNFINSGFYIGLLFLAGHLYVGLGMLVSIFRSFINEIHIDYNRDTLEVTEGPIKWFGLGKLQLKSENIQGFYLKKGNSSTIGEQSVGNNMQIVAKYYNGKKRVVLKQIDIKNAEYLVELLNKTKDRLR